MPSAVAPGGAPSLNGDLITIDSLVGYPDEIAPTVYGLVEADQGYILNDIYREGAKLTGPSVMYTEDDPAVRQLDANRDLAPRAVGGSALNIGTTRGPKKLSFTENWSGYIEVTDENVRWEQVDEVQDQFTAAANSFSLKFQARGVAQATAFLTAKSRTVPTSNKWNTAYTSGLVNIDPATKPLYHIALAKKKFVTDKGGITPDTLIVHSTDYLSLFTVYEDKLDGLLNTLGLKLKVSDLQTLGTPLMCKAGAIGVISPEKPMDTEEDRKPKQKTTHYVLDTSLAFTAKNAGGGVLMPGTYA